MRLDALSLLVGSVAVSFVSVFGTFAVAQNTDCNLKEVERLPNAEVEAATDDNFACLLTKLDALASENSKLREQLSNGQVPSLRVPAGAVVAFDLSDGCPAGWRADFSKGNGKFILGVGKGTLAYRGIHHKPDIADNVVALSEVVWNDQGGAETHTLTPSQMPQHNHSLSTSHQAGSAIHDGLGGSNAEYGIDRDFSAPVGQADGSWGIMPKMLSQAGKSHPHNNMPPYVALYFCKKE